MCFLIHVSVCLCGLEVDLNFNTLHLPDCVCTCYFVVWTLLSHLYSPFWTHHVSPAYHCKCADTDAAWRRHIRRWQEAAVNSWPPARGWVTELQTDAELNPLAKSWAVRMSSNISHWTLESHTAGIFFPPFLLNVWHTLLLLPEIIECLTVNKV